MTALTASAVQSLFGMFGGARVHAVADAPWRRHRTSEAELERLRLAEGRLSHRF